MGSDEGREKGGGTERGGRKKESKRKKEGEIQTEMVEGGKIKKDTEKGRNIQA